MRLFVFAGLLQHSIDRRPADVQAPGYLSGVAAVEQGQHLGDELLARGGRAGGDVAFFALEFCPHGGFCGGDLVGRLAGDLWEFGQDVVKDAINKIGLGGDQVFECGRLAGWRCGHGCGVQGVTSLG